MNTDAISNIVHTRYEWAHTCLANARHYLECAALSDDAERRVKLMAWVAGELALADTWRTCAREWRETGRQMYPKRRAA